MLPLKRDLAWLDTTAWPFPPRRFEGSEGVLHYVDEGSGPAILFVHGTPTWSFDYRHQLKALAGTHRVIAVDQLGFGLSERPLAADYSPQAHARRFSEFASSLKLEKVTLVVHDFGGPFALDWALENVHRLDRLIVLNSFMWSFREDARMRRLAAFMGTGIGRFLYRHLNFSLRVLVPTSYGDRTNSPLRSTASTSLASPTPTAGNSSCTPWRNR